MCIVVRVTQIKLDKKKYISSTSTIVVSKSPLNIKSHQSICVSRDEASGVYIYQIHHLKRLKILSNSAYSKHTMKNTQNNPHKLPIVMVLQHQYM